MTKIQNETLAQYFDIPLLSDKMNANIELAMNQKTKPPGSLGKLEQIGIKLGSIQKSLTPTIAQPEILVFAGDHGLCARGVSPWPQEVTRQMVLNFVSGGAAINVMCRSNNIGLSIVDAGIKGPKISSSQIIDARVAEGTKDSYSQPAMSWAQFELCIKSGREIAREKIHGGCDLLGLGEMGIGNSSAAALITAAICDVDLTKVTGPGAGSDGNQLERKKQILLDVLSSHDPSADALDLCRRFAGFEMVMALGAALESASQNVPVVVDGFIISAAILAGISAQPKLKPYCLFSHRSASPGHRYICEELKVEPILDLNMRLGEGSGAAMAIPVIRTSADILREMATFEQAEVSDKL